MFGFCVFSIQHTKYWSKREREEDEINLTEQKTKTKTNNIHSVTNTRKTMTPHFLTQTKNACNRKNERNTNTNAGRESNYVKDSFLLFSATEIERYKTERANHKRRWKCVVQPECTFVF